MTNQEILQDLEFLGKESINIKYIRNTYGDNFNKSKAKGYPKSISQRIKGVFRDSASKKREKESLNLLVERDYNLWNRYRLTMNKYQCSVDTDMMTVIKKMDNLMSYSDVDIKYGKDKHDLGMLYLKSEMGQEIFAKRVCKEELKKYLADTSDVIKMTNQEKEQYLLLVQEMIQSLPQTIKNIRVIEQTVKDPILTKKENDKILTLRLETNNLYAHLKDVSVIARIILNSLEKYNSKWKEFKHDCKGTFVGEEGERAVLEELKFFSNQMEILTNIRFEINGQSVESDIIVVAPQGIFVIEVKNLGSTGSYNITIEKDGLWKKVMKNGRWKQMGSVSRQNTRHLHGIEQVINSKLNNSVEQWIEAKSLIVFANDVVEIRNYSDNVVVRASEMVKEIRKYPQCLKEQQIQEVADILRQETLLPKKYEVQNWYKFLVETKLEIIDKMDYIYPIAQSCVTMLKECSNVFSGYELPRCNRSGEMGGSVSLFDDEREYQKSVEELEQEKRAEQERQMEEERRIRERAENFINNKHSAYGEQSYEQKYFDFDAYMRGEIHSVYSEETRK